MKLVRDDLAIYHLSMKVISRSSGRSAVASAAYRCAVRLINERDGLTHDFTRRDGVEHCEIVLPQAVDAAWAMDRSALWNAAEMAENRKDARVAREFEIALPHELSAEQRLAATREFAQELAERYGTAVDFAIHAPHGKTDIRNHHAHIMMSVRQVGEEGFLDKSFMERENKWLLSHSQATTPMQLRELRQAWEQVANVHLAEAGLELRIDHRSHQERGLELAPTEHMGVHATQMQRRGLEVSRTRLEAGAAQRNAQVIAEKPEQVLELIIGEKSVFDRHDVAKTLHRYIDDPQAFQAAFAKVMASPELVQLQAGTEIDPEAHELARYSTREMVALEHGMSEGAARMAAVRGHGVEAEHVAAALAAETAAIQGRVAAAFLAKAVGSEAWAELSADERQSRIDAAGLSAEQNRAVEHITGAAQIAAVVGFAGAGKSTMMAAARSAWEAQGFKVHGAALSGKAAEGLEEASGIESRTLAAWDYGWQAGRGALGPKDILVIDEAGMVGSRQLARFVEEAERAGAKLVLVGDHEQLQAIGAGAPFRAIAERIGFAELAEVRRQRETWQQAASQDFARHRTVEGLAAYEAHGAVHFAATPTEARAEIVRDYMTDLTDRPEGSRVAMAHRRVDVHALNEGIRAALKQAGHFSQGVHGSGDQWHGEAPKEDLTERMFATQNGQRAFAAGDRIVFLENNRDLGVKNGMLGTVTEVEEGRLVAALDGKGRDGETRVVAVTVADYAAFDHGYATTIHKTQGATVDQAFVLASGTMDRHLTYVAMTRHREEVRLYAAREEFKGRGAEPSSMEALAARLSRDGSKETTLDYTQEFSERRGMAAQLGIVSEIEVLAPTAPAHQALAQNEARAAIVTQAEPALERPEVEAETAALLLDPDRLSSSAQLPQRHDAGQPHDAWIASEGFVQGGSLAPRPSVIDDSVDEAGDEAREQALAAAEAKRREDEEWLEAVEEARKQIEIERAAAAQAAEMERLETYLIETYAEAGEKMALEAHDAQQREDLERLEALLESHADRGIEMALAAAQAAEMERLETYLIETYAEAGEKMALAAHDRHLARLEAQRQAREEEHEHVQSM